MTEPPVVGQRVRVKKANEATFQIYGKCKTPGDYSTWVDDPPRPWYPHGQEVTVREVRDSHVLVTDDTGKQWGYPIGIWAIEAV
jgi:hypothetical protein